MNWIKTHYDRALLIFAAALALLGSAFIVLKAGGFRSQFVREEKPQGRKLETLDDATVKAASARLGREIARVSPKLGEHQPIPLFASSPFVVMNDKPDSPIPMYEAAAPKLREPIENWWLVQHDLDYTAIDVQSQDPDRDGYTNLDEWLGKTDPNSSLSRPPFDTKLYFAERLENPLTLRLSAFDSGTATIAFITKDAGGNEQRVNDYIKVGEASKRFESGRFRVEEVKMETVERFGSPTQVAVAFVTDAKDKKGGKLRLEQGKLVEHPSYLAKVIDTLSAQTFELKEGEDFELRKPAGMTLTLDEIHADHIIIRYIPEGKTEEVRLKKTLGAPPK